MFGSIFGDDDDSIDNKELQKRINKKHQDLKETQQELQTHEEEYQDLIERGAQAPGAMRKVFAIQAQFEKVKYSFVKLDFFAQIQEIMELYGHQGKKSVEQLRERVEGRVGPTADLPDLEMSDFQENLKEARASVETELEELQGMTQTLDNASSLDDISMPASEEEELMDEMRAGDVSREEVDIEEMTESEDVDAAVDFDDDELGFTT